MKSNKFIGMIQPVKSKNENNEQPDLHKIGCLGKITSFRETNDGRYLIEIKGVIRFQTIEEIKTNNKYREVMVDFNKFYKDLDDNDEMMLVGAGAKGRDPLIFQNNGLPWRGFLEGRIQDDSYTLLLRLSNLELKSLNS